ncbi:MAG: transposase family protein [Chlorobi bacterium]|nr:transposase family protein [Chlorobiota bacterium]MBK8911552.1 transposase family protein [Chlorobiota bacterium]
MRYAEICDRSPEQFRRLTGVLPTTFEAMLKVIRAARREFGRPPKLVLADQLLLTLLYWREYRAQYHLAADFGISEPTCSRIIRRVEDELTQSKEFQLPQRPQPRGGDIEFAVIVIDATESPIERPKKSKGSTTAGSVDATQSRRR